MAYPCLICGGETGPSGLCVDCKHEMDKRTIIVNGQWCETHQIIHWREERCPICDHNEVYHGHAEWPQKEGQKLLTLEEVMKACSACNKRNNMM